MVMVSIFRIKSEEKDNVFAIFSESEFISGMEKTRKIEDGKCILITIEDKKYRALVEEDAFLEKFFTNVSLGGSHPPPTKNKNFST